jgi:hypothetical protein
MNSSSGLLPQPAFRKSQSPQGQTWLIVRDDNLKPFLFVLGRVIGAPAHLTCFECGHGRFEEVVLITTG